MSIASSIQKIQKRIATVTDREVTIVAVTKHRTPEEVREAVEAGIRVIGENRWQEAESKLDQLPAGVIKHFIGHLQTNKVKFVAQAFDLIQSVDSLHLAQKIDAECAHIEKVMPVLIEVNTSDEPQKTGAPFGKAIDLAKAISLLQNIKIEGLMTMAIRSKDSEKIRSCFRRLREMSEAIDRQKIPGVTLKTLSMGMTEDYVMAVEEGSTMVRIGRGIFDRS